MRRSTFLILAALSYTAAFPLRVGPSIRWVIPKKTVYWDRGSVSYEMSTSNIIFGESELLVPGLEIEASISENLSIDIGAFWRNYEPAYVTPPDSALFAIDRSGSFSLYILEARRTIGGIFVCVGAEAHYFREMWTDPFQGNQKLHDSLSIGPTICTGSMVDLPAGSLKFHMGLIFPGFSELWGRIGVSLLLP